MNAPYDDNESDETHDYDFLVNRPIKSGCAPFIVVAMLVTLGALFLISLETCKST